MKKNVWIWNHYATNMFKDQAGRHYWFAKNLKRIGYQTTIFCASTFHNSKETIDTGSQKYIFDQSTDIPFVFVKTPRYEGNGFRRVQNMFSFFKNIFPVAKEYANKHGKPDVILASSVHPLTLVAGIFVAKKFGIPCICEVRDLWPESLVAYGILKKKSLLTKMLYQGEKWIYKKADYIIMTWEGGREYIIDQNWENQIKLDRIVHISNGVDIDTFDKNSEEFIINDPDLNNNFFKNIVYTGSIRKVNNIGILLDVAKIVKSKGLKDVRFLIYGSGDETEKLKKRCEIENIDNVLFKGRVERKYIPYILKKSYVNILHNSSTTLDKYGQSQNKLFEYLAAGRCIVQTYTTGYSIIEKYKCGICAPDQTAEEIAKAVITACNNEQMNKIMGQNARKASFDYDFKILTNKLVNIIEKL